MPELAAGEGGEDSGLVFTMDALLAMTLSVLILSSVSVHHFPYPNMEALDAQRLAHDLLNSCAQSSEHPQACSLSFPPERACGTKTLESIAGRFPAFRFYVQYEDPWMLGVLPEALDDGAGGDSYAKWFAANEAAIESSAMNDALATQWIQYVTFARDRLTGDEAAAGSLRNRIATDAQSPTIDYLTKYGLNFYGADPAAATQAQKDADLLLDGLAPRLFGGTFVDKLLFGWSAVPGGGDGLVKGFLKERFAPLGWVDAATIAKIDAGEAIRIESVPDWAEVRLSADHTSATVTLSDGRTQPLVVRTEGGQLNVYDDKSPRQYAAATVQQAKDDALAIADHAQAITAAGNLPTTVDFAGELGGDQERFVKFRRCFDNSRYAGAAVCQKPFGFFCPGCTIPQNVRTRYCAEREVTLCGLNLGRDRCGALVHIGDAAFKATCAANPNTPQCIAARGQPLACPKVTTVKVCVWRE